MILRADGSFCRGTGDAGHWTATQLQNHEIVVLAWDRWPAETVTMTGPDTLRGKAWSGGPSFGEMVMQRVGK